MAKFNSIIEKLKYIWDLSQDTEYKSLIESKKDRFNKKEFKEAIKSISIFNKLHDFSTDWEYLSYINDRTLYKTFEIKVLQLPENYVENLKTDIVFRKTNSRFSLNTNYFYKNKTIQIEDIEDSFNKNVTINYQIYVGGLINIVGLEAKMLCYLYPKININL